MRYAAFWPACPVWDELPPMFVLMLPEEPESLRLQAVRGQRCRQRAAQDHVQDIFFIIIKRSLSCPHREGAFGLVCPESSGFISRLPRSVVSFTLKGLSSRSTLSSTVPGQAGAAFRHLYLAALWQRGPYIVPQNCHLTVVLQQYTALKV